VILVPITDFNITVLITIELFPFLISVPANTFEPGIVGDGNLLTQVDEHDGFEMVFRMVFRMVQDGVPLVMLEPDTVLSEMAIFLLK
jgi:hypothetical protein